VVVNSDSTGENVNPATMSLGIHASCPRAPVGNRQVVSVVEATDHEGTCGGACVMT
jgi:hypothetical protein